MKLVDKTISIFSKNSKVYKLFTFILLFLILSFLNIDVIKQPYLMMEDGFVFINGFMREGIKSLFFSYGGYICIGSRIIALSSIVLGKLFNSALVEVFANKIISMIVVVYILNMINDKRFSFLCKNRIIRLFFSIVLLLLSTNFLSIMYTNLSMNWWSGIYIILWIFLLFNNEKPRIHETILLIISILSTPFSFIILIPLFFKLLSIKKKNIGKSEVVLYLLLGIGIIIQVFMIITSKNVDSASNISIGVNGFIDIIKYTICLCFMSMNFLFSPICYLYFTNCLSISIIIGFCIFLVLFIIAIKDKKVLYLLSVCSITFIIYFLMLFKNSQNVGNYYYEFVTTHHNIWYSFIPAFNAYIISFFILSKYYKKKLFLVLHFVFLLVISFMLYKGYYEPDLSYTHYLNSIEKNVDYNSNYLTCVSTPPKWVDWCVLIPVKEDYCEVNANECIEKTQ